MEIKYSKNKIEFEKVLNQLDELVIDFTSILNVLGIKYVIISGYVAILFGRSRASEDIDIFIEKISSSLFEQLWKELYKKFECVITEDIKDAYEEYLLNGHAIRFARRGEYVPNVEIKFPKAEIDFWSLKESRQVILNQHPMFISPLELQIPYKIFLGSDKDIEDARYLYNLFKNKLDIILIGRFNRKLKIDKVFYKYLK